MEQKPFLILDTSTERGLVAVAQGDRVVRERLLPVGLRNSSTLMPAVAEMIAPSELGGVVVTVGPGSYTGIRVGVAAAKGIVLALSLPLVGVPSLEGFVGDGAFAAVIDAKIGGVYLKRWDGGCHLIPLEEVSEALQGIEEVVTPSAASLRQRCPELSVRWRESPPSGAALWRAAQERMARGEYALDGEVDLLYLRKTQAEQGLECFGGFR